MPKKEELLVKNNVELFLYFQTDDFIVSIWLCLVLWLCRARFLNMTFANFFAQIICLIINFMKNITYNIIVGSVMILGLAKPSLRFMSEVVKPPRESSQGTLTSQCTNRYIKQRLRINQTISYRSILARPSRTFVLFTRQKDQPV